jgi:hypothetical protein
MDALYVSDFVSLLTLGCWPIGCNGIHVGAARKGPLIDQERRQLPAAYRAVHGSREHSSTTEIEVGY